MSSSSVRDSVKQRKHNGQTVLQVVSEAQLCEDLTVDYLFCCSFSCIHMEEDGNDDSKWVYE